MTSFAKASKTEKTVAEAEAPEANEVQGQQLAVPTVPFKIGGMSGDVDRSDIKHPTLNIVQSVGGLSEDHEPGKIVLNREAEIGGADTPVNLTVLNFRTLYMKNVPYGGEEQPTYFNTLDEVKAAGLHCEWIGDKRPPASKLADALVAVESATEQPLFPYEFDGKYYAVAIWRLTGSSYTRAGKLIATAGSFNLKDGLHKGSWSLSTRREKLGVNWVHVPVLKAGPRNSPELVSFFEKLA